MTDIDLLLGLSAFAFVSSITPGPNNLMLMASGINFGFVRTIPHMLGVSLGFVVMAVLVGLGLAQVFAASPLAWQILKWSSVIYLLYLAWKVATSAGPAEGEASSAKPFSFMQAVLFQWVNPKAWTMALTATTAYVPTSNPLGGLILVAVVFGLINLPTVGAWALAGSQMRRFLSNRRNLRIFNIIAAGLLVASLYPVVFDIK